MKDYINFEYLWIDGYNRIRSKTRIFYYENKYLDYNTIDTREYIKELIERDIPCSNNQFTEEYKIVDFFPIPKWNYDGSSTGQCDGENTEVILEPRFICKNPIKDEWNNLLVMCDTYYPNGDITQKRPNIEYNKRQKYKNNKWYYVDTKEEHQEYLQIMNETNHRVKASVICEQSKDSKPWFAFEQEYYILDKYTLRPIGFNENDYLTNYNNERNYCKRGYCRVGGNHADSIMSEMTKEHLDLCLKAGLTMSGMNAEVGISQWEYQVGPVEGVEAGDQLWISRYLLEKLSEKYNVVIHWEPSLSLNFIWDGKSYKPTDLFHQLNYIDFPGSGCHTNFSTLKMREGTLDKNGLYYIKEAIHKMEKTSNQDVLYYGMNTQSRLTGRNETASYDEFTWSVGGRSTSIRITQDTMRDKKGYLEDRRPSANCDPYLVIYRILKSILNE